MQDGIKVKPCLQRGSLNYKWHPIVFFVRCKTHPCLLVEPPMSSTHFLWTHLATIPCFLLQLVEKIALHFRILISGLPCQKQVPRAGTRNYILQYLQDRIIVPALVPEAGFKERGKWLHPTVSMACQYLSLFLCQKQVSRTGTGNYIPLIPWDVITCPCPW